MRKGCVGILVLGLLFVSLSDTGPGKKIGKGQQDEEADESLHGETLVKGEPGCVSARRWASKPRRTLLLGILCQELRVSLDNPNLGWHAFAAGARFLRYVQVLIGRESMAPSELVHRFSRYPCR